MPLHPSTIHLTDVEPTIGHLRCIQKVVRSFFDQENPHHCPWGYLKDKKLRELTQQSFMEFITLRWTDAADPLVPPLHVQEFFVWFDGKRVKLELDRVTESEVLYAIDRLIGKGSFWNA